MEELWVNPSPKEMSSIWRECFSCKKKGHFKQFCQSSQHNHSQSCGGDSRKSRKDMHDIDQEDETSFQMQDYDSVNVKTVHVTTDVHHTAHTNIAFDEISSDRKLQCLLTDMKISNESCVYSTVRIKLVAIYCHLTFTRTFILRYLLKICIKQLIKGFA